MTGIDMALSFQEIEGCKAIGYVSLIKRICESDI